MKKTNNPFKIFLAILVVALIGTALVKCAEYFFGMANVFLVSTIVVGVFGTIIVPMLQLKERNRKNSLAYIKARTKVLSKI